MKPIAVVIVVALTVAIVHFGNGCSSSFKTLEDSEMSSQLGQSCASDESTLASKLRPVRAGYIGDVRVFYVQRGGDWIELEGDKLYKVRGGVLPANPGESGVSEGVGVMSAQTWPGGVLPYVIDSSLPNQQRVTEAVNHWNTNLSGVIRLIPRTNETDYAAFIHDASGCSSPVGRYAGEGAHPIRLADACGSGNATHEIGHMLGLDHEQNRYDRDSFVQIVWSKVNTQYTHNFQIPAGHSNYGSYNFGSIMHYGLTAFSLDGGQTIVPKVAVPAGVTVGQRSGLSAGDIQAIREMYGAGTATPTPTPSVTATPSPSVTPLSEQGLYGNYYEGVDFKNLKKQKIDGVLSFNWAGAAPIPELPSDFFSIRWKGWVKPTVSGTYVFSVSGQDGYRLKINGQALLNELDGVGYSSQISSGMALSAGSLYAVEIEMLARTGNASFEFKWRRNSDSETIVPASVLIPDQSGPAPQPCP